MEKKETVKNERGANLAIGEVRPNTYNDYGGCTMDVEIIVYSDDFKRSFSFWLEDIDTGYSGESWMDGYCDDELENNPDFKDDWGLGKIYTEEELEGCTALKNVTLPKSLKRINFDAFEGCPCEEAVMKECEERSIII